MVGVGTQNLQGPFQPKPFEGSMRMHLHPLLRAQAEGAAWAALTPPPHQRCCSPTGPSPTQGSFSVHVQRGDDSCPGSIFSSRERDRK